MGPGPVKGEAAMEGKNEGSCEGGGRGRRKKNKKKIYFGSQKNAQNNL